MGAGASLSHQDSDEHVRSRVFGQSASAPQSSWAMTLESADRHLALSHYVLAEELYLVCLQQSRDLLGEEHEETLGFLNSLAISYSKQKQHDEAERLHQEVLARRLKRLGSSHPSVLQAQHNLAATLFCAGRFDSAEQLHGQCLAAREKVLGEAHEDTVASGRALVLCLAERGQYSKAEDLLRLTLRRQLQQQRMLLHEKEESVEEVSLAYILCGLLEAQGRIVEARQLCREALDRCKTFKSVHVEQLRQQGREYLEVLEGDDEREIALYYKSL